MTGLIGAAADLITTVLTVLALAIGSLVLLCWTLFGVMGAIAFVQVRRRRRAEIGDDVIAEFGPDAEFDAQLREWLRNGDHRG